jgi:hypothetical protein
MSRNHLPTAVPAGVDRLLGRVRGRSASFDRPNDIFQIPDASGEPVDACYHRHMTDAFRKACFDKLGLISLLDRHRRLRHAS